MVFTTQKRTYYGVIIDDYTKTWGGLDYNTFLMDEIVNENLNYTDTTDADDIRFLLPFSPASSYVIDGVVEGFFAVYNAHAADTSTLNSYTVSLKKTADVPSAETTLATMSNTLSSETIAKETYGYYPIYFDVDQKTVDAEDELLLLYLSMDFTDGDLEWSHANDSANIDLEVSIPFP